eukprot:scaffold21370_cov67-Phaeocystis_antarctica.AAC.9
MSSVSPSSALGPGPAPAPAPAPSAPAVSLVAPPAVPPAAGLPRRPQRSAPGPRCARRQRSPCAPASDK